MKDTFVQVIKDPGNVLESVGQGMFDVADEKGIAYSAGYVTMDVVIAILTDKGLDKLKDVGKTTANMADDVTDAVEDAARAGKEAREAAQNAETVAEGLEGKVGKVLESGTDVLDEIKRIDEIEVEFNYNSKYDETEFARQLADQQKGMNELTVQEYLDNRQKYMEQGRAIESNAAQQAVREKAFVDKVDELQDAGLSLKEAEEQAQEWLDTQAALHNPDQVAGGHASVLTY